MALLPSVATRVTVELTRYRSAVSEFLAQTLGKSINYLLDRIDAIENALDGAIVSEVIGANQTYPGNTGFFTYNAPSGYTFSGCLLIEGTGNTQRLQVQIGGQVFDSAVSTGYATITIPLYGTSFSVTISSFGSPGTPMAIFIKGIAFKNADLTIP